MGKKPKSAPPADFPLDYYDRLRRIRERMNNHEANKAEQENQALKAELARLRNRAQDVAKKIGGPGVAVQVKTKRDKPKPGLMQSFRLGVKRLIEED